MKVLIVSPIQAVTPHFETELEIAQIHLDKNDEVIFMTCGGELPGCDLNIQADLKKCEVCRIKRRNGIKLLTKDVANEPICDKIKYPYISTLPKVLKTQNNIKHWQLDGRDLGWGVLSSLVSATQDPEPDLDRNRGLIRRFAASSEKVYYSVKKFICENNIDLVYIFNGRLHATRAVIAACEEQKTEYKVHERGANINLYEIFPNCLPHSIKYNSSEIINIWRNETNYELKKEIGSSWFTERRNKSSKDWYSYTSNQQENELPNDWNNKNYNITVFSSSEDEYVSVGGEWENHIYRSQLEGIKRLADDLELVNKKYHITVRMHPNQSRLKNHQTELLRRFKHARVKIIAPESPVDTYALVERSDVVVTFGSTVGIEAVYWGTPSVLLGRSFYQDLGAVHSAKSHEDGLKAILNPTLGNKEMTLAYGYWANTRGIPFKYFEAEGFFEGKFKGTQINGRLSFSALQKLKWSIKKRLKMLTEKYA
jgi:hypothetical protein